MVEKRAAKTGSKLKRTAVWLAFKIVWAQTINIIATKVAKKPVTKTATRSLCEIIISGLSNIKTPKDENNDTNITWDKNILDIDDPFER